MEISLNTRELIHLYLKTYLHDPYIRKIIIDEKFLCEHKDNIRYHIDTWNYIATAFYYAKDNQSSYSLVYDNNNYNSHIFFSSIRPPQYIIVPDHIHDFYNITNVSYQSRELIHDLIKTYGTYGNDEMNNDDILYSELSRQINLFMKNNT